MDLYSKIEKLEKALKTLSASLKKPSAKITQPTPISEKDTTKQIEQTANAAGMKIAMPKQPKVTINPKTGQWKLPS